MNHVMTGKSIGFIGAGIMGTALIKSLLNSSIKAEQIFISEKNESRAQEVVNNYQVKSCSIHEIARSCDVIFLAVKPQDLENTLLELSTDLEQGALLISIAAGKTTKFIESKLKSKNAVGIAGAKN